jgi:hypothetical protein
MLTQLPAAGSFEEDLYFRMCPVHRLECSESIDGAAWASGVTCPAGHALAPGVWEVARRSNAQASSEAVPFPWFQSALEDATSKARHRAYRGAR